MKRFKAFILTLCLGFTASTTVQASGVGEALCTNANVFTKIMDQMCWSCMLPFRMSGIGPNAPEGAASSQLLCLCKDDNGVYKPPGVPLGYWSPRRLIETVKLPWCSPSLGGMRLQDTIVGLGERGKAGGSAPDTDSGTNAFYQYHYFSYPIMQMLSLFVVPECQRDQYVDFDILYLSEIDPTWNNPLLAFVLNPEAALFANPLAQIMCTVDCGLITSGIAKEQNYFCAGCDGTLYPFTGQVSGGGQPARNTSLVAQRVLASLHRKGLSKRTMGNDAMCEPQYAPMVPKSMYKLSAIHPLPEADGDAMVTVPERDSDGNEILGDDGEPKTKSVKAGCCHPLGDMVYKWRGVTGETIPGVGEDYVYMQFQYVDCCLAR